VRTLVHSIARGGIRRQLPRPARLWHESRAAGRRPKFPAVARRSRGVFAGSPRIASRGARRPPLEGGPRRDLLGRQARGRAPTPTSGTDRRPGLALPWVLPEGGPVVWPTASDSLGAANRADSSLSRPAERSGTVHRDPAMAGIHPEGRAEP